MTSQPDPAATKPVAVRAGASAQAQEDTGPPVDATAMVAELAGRQGLVDKRADLAVDLGVVAIGIFLIVGSFSIRHGLVQREIIGAAGLPRLLGAFLTVAGLILVARRLKGWSSSPLLVPSEGGDADEPGYPSTYVRPFVFLIMGLVWTVLLSTLGYVLATPLLGFAVLYLARVRSWPKLVGVPLGFTIVTWLLFDRLIGILLPPGDFIGRWLDLNVPRF